MLYKMVITTVEHIRADSIWVSKLTEATQEEFEDTKNKFKQMLPNMTYLEIDDVILPGDFIRHHCYIKFVCISK